MAPPWEARAARPLIVVPDDFPSVFEGTPAHERCRQLGEVRVFTARGADEEAELIRRADRAHVVINIRAHARFTEGVFAACKNLKMISIWGTGTDNVDLNAAGLRGDAGRVAALGARAAAKEEILREADVVSLHLRLTPETRGFIGRKELSVMKRTALLINTARGALIERDALVDALVQGKIGGAGLDVFHDEPLKPGDAILKLENVVLSPHSAGQTPEVIRDGLLRAVENVENFLSGQPTDVVVAPAK